MFFEQILAELNNAKIRYVLIGGVAVNLHGFPRATGDLDILISLNSRNIKKFINLVKKLKWKPRVPVELDAFADVKIRKTWIAEKGMKVFSVFNPDKPIEHIDVMMENYIDFQKAYRRKKVISIGRMKVPVASIDDLIQLKRIAGRERDKIDIRALTEIRKLQK